MKYKEWTIEFNKKSIPTKKFDFEAVHEDYDGENDLFFYCESEEEAKKEIDYREELNDN